FSLSGPLNGTTKHTTRSTASTSSQKSPISWRVFDARLRSKRQLILTMTAQKPLDVRDRELVYELDWDTTIGMMVQKTFFSQQLKTAGNIHKRRFRRANLQDCLEFRQGSTDDTDELRR